MRFRPIGAVVGSLGREPQGTSPCKTASPSGATDKPHRTAGLQHVRSVAPLGLGVQCHAIQGLTPLATDLAPLRGERRNALLVNSRFEFQVLRRLLVRQEEAADVVTADRQHACE